jgi:hypothetical protein
MIAVLINAYLSAIMIHLLGNTYNTQAQTGSIFRCFPAQIDIRADDSGQTTHSTRDGDGDMSLSIRFGIVADPSQVPGITQFTTCRNEDASQISGTDKSSLDWECEDQYETNENHALTKEETGVTFSDSIAVPPSEEGEDTTNNVAV